ncbi:MAG: c-type cytochrome [Curvibacter sp.]|nr:c-type cytochrome [Curvibacter sp.]
MSTQARSFRLVFLAAMLPLILGACAVEDRTPSQEQLAMTGPQLVQKVCSQCHGLTGESESPGFPKLAGQQRAYLHLQLTDFKGHLRSDSAGTQYMWGFTHLSSRQIDELSDYFSAQQPMRSSEHGSHPRGETIFRQGLPELGVVQCAACHGERAEGRDDIPRLAGQHVQYLERQIAVFKHTDQRPRGAAMKAVTHALSDEDAQAVARYIASLGA